MKAELIHELVTADVIATSSAYATRAHIVDLFNQLKAAERERDEAQAQLAVASNNARHYADRTSELEAQCADLRGALEVIDRELMTIAYGKQEEIRNDVTAGESHGWCAAHDHIGPIIAGALTRTAPQSLGRIKAEALRELMQEVENRRPTLVATFGEMNIGDVFAVVADLTDRLEKEATDG